MKGMKTLVILIALAFAFQACDKVEPPYINGIDCEVGTKKVLIEDYTGHGCVNCPGAAVVAHNLQEQCEDRIIIMAVHAGYFASTEAFGPEYTYDFNTEAGTTWNDYYSIVGNPKGMVNRVDGGSGVVTVPDKWDKTLVSELALTADVEVNISNTYNENDSTITTVISGEFLSEIEGKFNLVVCITENDIVEPQKNNDTEIGDVPDDLDYVHQHVLRMVINDSWGQEIASGQVSIGQKYSRTYTEDFKGHDWVPENCHIVAFVYQDSDKSILQVEEAAVVE